MQQLPPRGNSIAEYVLPIAIVCFILLIAITTIQPSLQKAVLGSVGSHPDAMKEAEAKVKMLGENPAFQTLTVTLDDGTRLSMPNYPTNMALAIETDGANGATEKLLASLDALIAQLESAGKLSSTESAQLKALSNSGHTLSDIMGHTEKELASFQGSKAALMNHYNINAPNVNRENWIERLDWRQSVDPHAVNQYVPFSSLPPQVVSQFSVLDFGKTMENRDASYISKDYAAFLQNYAAVEQSGVMQNSQLKAVVHDLSNQLVRVGLTLRSSIYQAGAAGVDVTPDKIISLTSSSLAHSDAKGICHTGKGSDSGVQCY